jgi:hypothetical protein
MAILMEGLLLLRFREGLFDLSIEWKTSDGRLGEDQRAVRDDIELSALARRQFRVLIETRLESGGQTGRTWAVSSSRTVENFS